MDGREVTSVLASGHPADRGNQRSNLNAVGEVALDLEELNAGL